eukprot:gb/GEZN01029760.1/.p2 GENE.gb/GEZN01029760.1/~~gb/GEZN01029760.1/.p2  ORF type:complete len:110 (-),score=0.64 gb/GEZN01029760.1/:129-458(-)
MTDCSEWSSFHTENVSSPSPPVFMDKPVITTSCRSIRGSILVIRSPGSFLVLRSRGLVDLRLIDRLVSLELYEKNAKSQATLLSRSRDIRRNCVFHLGYLDGSRACNFK